MKRTWVNDDAAANKSTTPSSRGGTATNPIWVNLMSDDDDDDDNKSSTPSPMIEPPARYLREMEDDRRIQLAELAREDMRHLAKELVKLPGVVALTRDAFYTNFADVMDVAAERLFVYDQTQGLGYDAEAAESETLASLRHGDAEERVRADCVAAHVKRARTANPILAKALADTGTPIGALADAKEIRTFGGNPNRTVAHVTEALLKAAAQLRPVDFTDLASNWLPKLADVAAIANQNARDTCSLILLPYRPKPADWSGGVSLGARLDLGLTRTQKNVIPWWHLFLLLLKQKPDLFARNTRSLFVFWPWHGTADAVDTDQKATQSVLSAALEQFTTVRAVHVGPADVNFETIDSHAHACLLRGADRAVRDMNGRSEKARTISMVLAMPLSCPSKLRSFQNRHGASSVALNMNLVPLVPTWSDVLADAAGIDRIGLVVAQLSRSKPFDEMGAYLLSPFVPFAYDFPGDMAQKWCAGLMLGLYATPAEADEEEEKEADEDARFAQRCVICAEPARFACACGQPDAVYCDDTGVCQRIHCAKKGHFHVCSHKA